MVSLFPTITPQFKVGNVNIELTHVTYQPKIPPKTPDNPSVNNRLAFAVMIKDVIANTPNPLTIHFNKKYKIKNVTSIVVKGKGVFDLSLITTTSRIPIAVHTTNGSWREHINVPKYGMIAYSQLDFVTEHEKISIEIDAQQRVNLSEPIAWQADTESVRELMLDDITNGFGLINNYNPVHYKYDGTKHILYIESRIMYKKSADLNAQNTPYYLIRNASDGQIGDIKGIQLDLVPKHILPSRIVILR